MAPPSLLEHAAEETRQGQWRPRDTRIKAGRAMWATRRMHGRGRFQGVRRSRLAGHASRASVSALLALLVFLLLALADAAGALPSTVTPLHARTAHAAPPTINIVSPNPPQGTGGTQLTVAGSGFAPGPMALNADSRQDCSVLATP